jgi:hypothetical protein
MNSLCKSGFHFYIKNPIKEALFLDLGINLPP